MWAVVMLQIGSYENDHVDNYNILFIEETRKVSYGYYKVHRYLPGLLHDIIWWLFSSYDTHAENFTAPKY
jgi:hypothetical protein